KTHIIPERWRKSIETIKKLLIPNGWRYVFRTDEDNDAFVKKYFPTYWGTYNTFPYTIQKVDAVRVMYLYIEGGLYMDLDYEILRPLDTLFENNNDLFFVASKNASLFITNSFLASKP